MSAFVSFLVVTGGPRTHKWSSGGTPTLIEMSTLDEGSNNVFVDEAAPHTEDHDMYGELYDDLHNKLNWLTVCYCVLTI